MFFWKIPYPFVWKMRYPPDINTRILICASIVAPLIFASFLLRCLSGSFVSTSC